MKIRSTCALMMVAAVASLAIAMQRFPCHVHAEPVAVTWRQQVAPVVFHNCTACHHTGGSGPFDLTTYASAKRWGTQIADVVQSRYMPPWLPEPTAGPNPVHFEGDRRLSPADIELLTLWVKSGMPEGDGPAPQQPVYSKDWQMGPPDLVLEMPESIAVPASGSDQFMNFVLPSDVTQTQWVRAMEIQPGAGVLVHHANVILDRTASLRAEHPADWRHGIPGMDLLIDSGDAFDPDSHFLFWKSDSTALVEPPGMPWRLDPGNDLILNMHLNPTGNPEQVRPRVGLYFTTTPATAHPMLIQLEHDAALDIPAGDANFTVTDQLKLPVAVDVLGIYPHAHYLCREMKGWATLPNGQEQPLLSIRNWDIDRQSVYRLEKPLPLPAGTVLHMRYIYDNSAANVHNPASPPVRVHAGNRAADEMGHLWLQVLPHGDGHSDPRFPVERAWMENVLRKSPADQLALYNLGALSQMAGKLQDAEVFYKRLLAERPNDPRALTSLGSALETASDQNGAAAQYKAALVADPDYTDAAFNLAKLDLKTGQSAAAEPLLRNILRKDPDDSAAADALAQSLASQDRLPEAGPILLNVLLHHPKDADAHRLLAVYYTGQGNASKTLEHLQAWEQAAGEQLDPHRALAQVLSAAGRDDEALAEQQTVLRLDANDPNDWNDLGAMEARSGHRSEARAAFEHALQLDPRNEPARNNLARLAASLAQK